MQTAASSVSMPPEKLAASSISHAASADASVIRGRKDEQIRPTPKTSVVAPEGRASAIRVQGEAEAAIILQKGEAEAKAMNVKAEAYQDWNQAAVVDRLISNMPEVVRAMAEPLSKVDRITIVSTGGDAAGANKITGDMAKMAAQVPALFETLSGMPLSELLGKVRQLGDKPAKPPVVDATKN